MGPATIRALQLLLASWGYAVAADGWLGNETAKAVRRSLNDRRWQ